MRPTEYWTVPLRQVFLRNRGQLLTGWRNARGQDRWRRLGIALSAMRCKERRTTKRT